jgi:hypothetical protein
MSVGGFDQHGGIPRGGDSGSQRAVALHATSVQVHRFEREVHMIRFSQRAVRSGLAALTIAAAGLLTACGPGAVKSTTVVLTGPHDEVEALMTQYKLQVPPARSRSEVLEDGRERTTVDLPKGLPLGQVVDLGKAAAKAGVNFEFSSGTKWGTDAPPDSPQPKRTGGPVA